MLEASCPDAADVNPVTGVCKCPSNKVLKGNQCVVPEPEACGKTGNPCDAATGIKYQTETDFVIDGTGISLIRSYNSAQTNDYGLGVGWTARFLKRLLIKGDQLLVQRGEGWQDPFAKLGGVWQGDMDTDFILTESGGFTIELPDGGKENYDTAGLLTSATTAAGLVTTYQYVGSQLTSITGPHGHTLTLAYDTSGHISSVSTPGGRVYTYTYDGSNNLTGVLYPDSTSRTYHYEDLNFQNALTGITDENGDRFAAFAYDTEGRAISTQYADSGSGSPQKQFILDYSGSPVTVVTDPIGQLWNYSYQQNLGLYQLLSKTSHSDGKGITQQFDANNNLISRTDEEGRTTTHAYNNSNQRTSTTLALGTPEERATSYGYHSTNIDLPTRVSTTSVYTESVREVLTGYDNNYNVTSITVNGFQLDGTPVSRATSFQYNNLGQVTQIDGPRSGGDDITKITYHECTTGNKCGQLASITNALGHVTTFDMYSDEGQLLRSTDPLGTVTTRVYDLRNRVTSMIQTPSVGSARTTTFTYDNAGQLNTMTTPGGNTLTYTYDAAHDLRSITDSLGNRIEYGYDLKGNRVREDTKDPDDTLVRKVQTVYDDRNRVRSVDAAGSITQTIRDAVGNLVIEIDPNLNPSTDHTYDALDRLTQTLDALSNTTTYLYNDQDRLTQVTAPNGVVTDYEYDDLGNRLKEISADRGTTNYSYDEAGNVTSITDARGITVSYTYDALNRVTRVDYPGADEDVTLVYDSNLPPSGAELCSDGIGRLCRVEDEGGYTEFAYDPWGNITAERRTELDRIYTTVYAYDAGNRVISMTYPSGRQVDYVRDAMGRITSVTTTVEGVSTDVVADRTYRADGLYTGQTYGDGTGETRSYDLQGRLEVQVIGDLETRTYDYDGNGNLTTRTQSTNGRDYDYDVLDRVTRNVRRVGKDSIVDYEDTYDPNGKRLTP